MTRKVGIGVLLALLIGLAAAAAASGDPLAGRWWSPDPDVGIASATLRLDAWGAGRYRVRWDEDGGSICDGQPGHGYGLALLGGSDPAALHAQMRFACGGTLWGQREVDFAYDPATDTLTGAASTWYRIPRQRDAPDTIFYDAHVITMNPDQPVAEALAIRGGDILAVGDTDEVLSLAHPRFTALLDLNGLTLTPGFIDSHSHWIGNYDLGGYASPEEAAAAAVASGWTSIDELFVTHERLMQLIALDEAGDLPERVNAYFPINAADDKSGYWWEDYGYEPGATFSDHVRVPGIKLFMDHNWGGTIHWTQSELDAVVVDAHQHGWQIAAHTLGADANAMLLNSLELALGDESNAAYRHRIEHLVQVSDDELARMAAKGIIASVQMVGPADWPDEPAFQAQLLDSGDPTGWLMRWRDFVEAGVPTVGNLDAPWVLCPGGTPFRLSAMRAIYEAVTRDGCTPRVLEDWQADQRLTVQQAMELLTINGAYATFEEDSKGSLERGKWADLVILSGDPFSVPAADIDDIEVWMTMVGGEVVYCHPGHADLCP